MKSQLIALGLFAAMLLTSARAQEVGRPNAAENNHQSLAWRSARVRAMEAAGNHRWLHGQPANHEREHPNPDRLPPGPVHGDRHGGHHCSGWRLRLAVD